MGLAPEGTGDGTRCLIFADLFSQASVKSPARYPFHQNILGFCQCGLEHAPSGKPGEGSISMQVWCLLPALFVVELKTVFKINNRGAQFFLSYLATNTRQCRGLGGGKPVSGIPVSILIIHGGYRKEKENERGQLDIRVWFWILF